MRTNRHYPDTGVGQFPEPPIEFRDASGRDIEIHAFDPRDASAIEDLVEMYVDFDPADRAQGIPPAGETKIREWLTTVLDNGLDVVAMHGDRIVGHATLVPDEIDTYELAIFVHQDYQQSGIGSKLLPALLGHGAAAGARRVWLTVERWNHPAIALYKSVGFEPCNLETFELEMSLRLP